MTIPVCGSTAHPDQVIMLRAASEIKLDSVYAKYNLVGFIRSSRLAQP